VTETKQHISLDPESLRTWQGDALEHIRYEYDLKPDSIVIDLGAYRGEWATEIHKQHGCMVVVVEPTEYINDFRHGPIVNKAAGTHEGKMPFGGRAYYTSTFEPGDHEYECFDVNKLLEQYEAIDLLKINIEGAEYDVLNHIIGAGLHNQIKNIQVQFHQIAGVPFELWYDEIADKLKKTHSLTWQYPYCWENWKINTPHA
jgi:FkbM family methyltransferase